MIIIIAPSCSCFIFHYLLCLSLFLSVCTYGSLTYPVLYFLNSSFGCLCVSVCLSIYQSFLMPFFLSVWYFLVWLSLPPSIRSEGADVFMCVVIATETSSIISLSPCFQLPTNSFLFSSFSFFKFLTINPYRCQRVFSRKPIVFWNQVDHLQCWILTKKILKIFSRILSLLRFTSKQSRTCQNF